MSFDAFNDSTKALTDPAMTEESFGLLGEEAAAAARAGAQGAQALRLG